MKWEDDDGWMTDQAVFVLFALPLFVTIFVALILAAQKGAS